MSDRHFVVNLECNDISDHGKALLHDGAASMCIDVEAVQHSSTSLALSQQIAASGIAMADIGMLTSLLSG